MIVDQASFSITKDFVWREEETGGLLYNIRTGELQLLNDLGVGILRFCEEGKAKHDIVEYIADTFSDVGREVVEVDVDTFLQSMLDMGVLTIDD